MRTWTTCVYRSPPPYLSPLPFIFLPPIRPQIPIPTRNFTAPPRLIVIRSFDVNKPGTDAMELQGGVAGGSLLEGVLVVCGVTVCMVVLASVFNLTCPAARLLLPAHKEILSDADTGWMVCMPV